MFLTKPRVIPVLTSAEAAATASRVFDLRRNWTQIQPDYEAYVLGTASYLALPFPEYQAQAAVSNALLRASLPELYERVFAELGPALAAVRNGPLLIEDGRALPGFQILLVDRTLRDPRGPFGSAHWDWNFLHLEWHSDLPADLTQLPVASFTLPILLPAAGGGLLFWEDLTSAEVNAFALERKVKLWNAVPFLTKDRSPSYQAYTPGQLVLHSGSLIHQVAPWQWRAGDVRITLQGHGLFFGGKWHIYW